MTMILPVLTWWVVLHVSPEAVEDPGMSVREAEGGGGTQLTQSQASQPQTTPQLQHPPVHNNTLT